MKINYGYYASPSQRDNTAHHVQQIIRKNYIGYGIIQGNVDDISYMLSRIHFDPGSANPKFLNYGGTKLELGMYSPTLDLYRNFTKDKTITNFKTLKNIQFRRWNFLKY